MFKCLNDLAPEYLCSKFSYPSHFHNTRYSTTKSLVISKCNLKTGQRAFSYKGATAWNSLNVTTRQAHNLPSLKRCLVKEILTKREVWWLPVYMVLLIRLLVYMVLLILYTYHFILCFVLWCPVSPVNSVFVFMSGPLWKSVFTVRATW